MKAEALNPAWSSRTTELELPEEINLQLELANVGSRTLAILADVALCGLILFVVYSLTYLVHSDVAMEWMAQKLLVVVIVFGFQWIYFNVFEWWWNGQTPGKRLLHLRVIKLDGRPISWIDVLLRNLARPVDSFGPMGMIGLFMIFISRKAQRLGDVMAQTLVIHETPINWSIFDQLEEREIPEAAAAPRSAVPAIRLTPAQWELLHRYLNRREQLTAEVRANVATSLHSTLKPSVKGTDLERSELPPQEWLVELARRT